MKAMSQKDKLMKITGVEQDESINHITIFCRIIPENAQG